MAPPGVIFLHDNVNIFYIFFSKGNNWGTCPNGTGAVGCGPQEEFRACADIQIGGKDIPTTSENPIHLPTTPRPTKTTSATTTTKPTILPTPAPSYSPITAIIISFVSFLVVFLVFLLLYFHYYQVGERIKKWIKNKPREKFDKQSEEEKPQVQVMAPMPPPRVKRGKKGDEMQEVDLSGESLA